MAGVWNNTLFMFGGRDSYVDPCPESVKLLPGEEDDGIPFRAFKWVIGVRV
jgi:hypothetical protein